MNGNSGRISILVSFAVLLPDICVSGRREGTQARERTRPLRKAASVMEVCSERQSYKKHAEEGDLIKTHL